MSCAKCGQPTASEFHGLCDACYLHVGRARQDRIRELEAENAKLREVIAGLESARGQEGKSVAGSECIMKYASGKPIGD